MTFLKKLIFCIPLLLLCTLSLAAKDTNQASLPTTEQPVSQDFSPLTLYVGGNVGFSTTVISKALPGPVVDSPLTLKGDIGYQFNQYLGAEAGFGYIFPHDNVVALQKSHSTYTYLAAKLMLPLMQNRADLYAKVGGAYFHSTFPLSPLAHISGVYSGAGVDFRITPKVLINFDTSAPILSTSLEEFGSTVFLPVTYTLGLAYCF
jgi:hypothetical protein